MLQLNIINMCIPLSINVCNFESLRSISINFTNFAQFCKKERQKEQLFFIELLSCMLNASFFIFGKIVFAKIMIFHISELNALRVGKLSRKRTLLMNKISHRAQAFIEKIKFSTFLFDVLNDPNGSSLLTRWWLCKPWYLNFSKWYEVESYTLLGAPLWMVKSLIGSCDYCVIYRLKTDFYRPHQKSKTTLLVKGSHCWKLQAHTS